MKNNIEYFLDYIGKNKENTIKNLLSAGLKECNSCHMFMGEEYIDIDGFCDDNSCQNKKREIQCKN